MRCIIHRDEDALFNCYLCRNPICPDCATEQNGRSICPVCIARFQQRKAAVIESETKDPHCYCAAALGLIAAVTGAWAWSQFVVMGVGTRLDVFALALGGLIAYAVMRGAGGKRGQQLQQLAALLTLAGVLLGYYLILLRAYQGFYTGVAGVNPSGTAALYAFPGFLGDLGIIPWLLMAAAITLAWYLPHPRKA
jgi:hypothetical protein